MRIVTRSCVILLAATLMGASAPAPVKPKVAIFPLAGAATDEARERVGFALRKKLDRDGAYDVIDGYAMRDLTEGKPVPLDTTADAVAKMAKSEGAAVLIWGNLDGKADDAAGSTLTLKVLDLRDKDAKPREVVKKIAEPTDLRFAVEEVLAALPGVKPFEHPNENAVRDDATSKALWATNPNLVANGDFAKDGHWAGVYDAAPYPLAASTRPPDADVDKVTIYPMPTGPDRMTADGGCIPAPRDNVLAMNLSRTAAENHGLAGVSDPIPVQPGKRYRLSFRYQSDGPSTHVFVKGYTTVKDAAGRPIEREAFRTQVPPTGPTRGQWQTVVCDVNPSHPTQPVERLRIDLYAYLAPGVIYFDDVVLKEIGPLVEKAAGDATKSPVHQD